MTSLHTGSPTPTPDLRHALQDAAERADRRLLEAARASERVHRQVDRALSPQALSDLGASARRWTGRSEALSDRLSGKAQQLAQQLTRQGMDLASLAGARAQASWNRYADATTGYVVQQPLRSLLLAAAAGATLAWLMARSRRD